MTFCRDCLADCADTATRCPACGSPRLARHRELDRLTIAHVDCDAFYATIEKRDDPSLLDKPVIVGGGKRGVVAAACYVARTYGIRSAMPMFEAKRRCPQAVVVKPNMAKYSKVGRDVRRAMLALTPLVEPLSIDEAFLDLTGTERLHGMSAARVLARFAGAGRARPRHHGFDRAVGQQVPRQDRLRPGQAARLRRARAGRGGGFSGAQAGRLHLRRRRGERGQARRRRLSADRRPAARRRARSHRAATARKARGCGGWRAASTRATSIRSATPRASRRKPPSSATSANSARSNSIYGI